MQRRIDTALAATRRVPGTPWAAIAGVLGTLVGASVGVPWLWPLFPTLLVFPLFADGVRLGRLGSTYGRILVWALACTVTMYALVGATGVDIGERVLRGPSYAAEMLHWIQTGEGPEGSPRLFLPIHARHYAAFLVGATATGGLAGLYFGTILLDYMNFYVASLATESGSPLSYAVGWPIWAVVRVLGYVAGGVALGHLFFCRIVALGTWNARGFRRWMGISVALVVLDVLLKATLADTWRAVLLRLFG